MTDLISRADAIEAVKETKPIVRSTERNWGKMIAEQHSKELVKALKALPSADAVDVAHDIPEYCSWSQTYTNMVQSAMADTKSAEAEQGFRGGKIPPKEMLDGTVLIPKHQWLEMERELAELKEKFESADAVQGEWIDVDNYYRLATCSRCHKVTMFEKWGEYTKPYNFCPNCGARMKGGAE